MIKTGLRRTWASAFGLAIIPAMVPLVAQAQSSGNAPAPAPVVIMPDDVQTDPARLAAAQITIDHIFPVGTYAKIMNTGQFTELMSRITPDVTAISIQEAAKLGGARPEEIAKLGKATLGDVLAILDPAAQRRHDIIMHAVLTEIIPIITQLEPAIRAGMAEAYARKFTAAQLTDINRFFDTPTGSVYAANIIPIQTDPLVVNKMQAIMPMIVQHLPDILEKIRAAVAAAHLPPPRKMEDLSPDERSKLMKLLGISGKKAP